MQEALHSTKSAGLFICNELYKLRRTITVGKRKHFLVDKMSSGGIYTLQL
jgi:hypothetical protein